MSLQSIMDATPLISWGGNTFGDYIGSGYETSYLIAKQASSYELWWRGSQCEESKRILTDKPQEIINKINELEGISNVKPT